MAAVEALLCGEEDIEFPDLDEAKLKYFEQVLARRCDVYEDSLRAKFEEMASGDQTVADILDVMKVS